VSPGPALTVDVLSTYLDLAVVRVTGELDVDTTPLLRGHLVDCINNGHVKFVLDLSGLSFCDSSGLHLLVTTAGRVRSRDGFVRLSSPTRQVRRVLHLTGLTAVLPVYPTVAVAVADAVTRAAGADLPSWQPQAGDDGRQYDTHDRTHDRTEQG
jgi:anti-sigma B factor antagonist